LLYSSTEAAVLEAYLQRTAVSERLVIFTTSVQLDELSGISDVLLLFYIIAADFASASVFVSDAPNKISTFSC